MDDYPQKPEKPAPKSSFTQMLSATTIAILVAVFVFGIGVGVAFSSAASAPTGSLATRYDLDKVAPSADLCLNFGASAVTMDVRAFVTLNPIAVYITQPKTQPGCVIRSSNFSILEKGNLITPEQSRECRQRLNTFGFTGAIDRKDGNPQIECVYQNSAAGNLFLNQTGLGGEVPAESQRF
jgi:hypothetical protein